MRQLVRIVILVLALASLAAAQVPATQPATQPGRRGGRAGGPPPPNPNLPTLWIAGDSTAASGNSGWGNHMADYLDTTKLNVANRSAGGQSTRTFISSGNWERIHSQVKAGDWVIIQFGHNDISEINDARVSRGVIQSLGEETQEIENGVTHQQEVVHTFGWYMRKMIAETQEKKAIPIVMSMTVRNWWKDNKVERGAFEMARFAIQIAKAQKVMYVDLNNMVADEYEQPTMGVEKVAALYVADKTHSTVPGADFNAAHVTAGLRALKDHPFDAFLTAKGKEIKPAEAYAGD